jgi:hypothetical protein
MSAFGHRRPEADWLKTTQLRSTDRRRRFSKADVRHVFGNLSLGLYFEFKD